MRGKILFLVFLLLLVPAVSAVETKIDIKGLAFHGVVIRVQDTSGTQTFQSIYGKTDIYGKANATYFTRADQQFQLLVLLVKDGKAVMSDTFGPFKTGEPVSVSFIPEDDSQLNEDIAEENNTAEESNYSLVALEDDLDDEVEESEPNLSDENVSVLGVGNASATITGAAVWGESKSVYYVIGGVVLILVFGFLLLGFLKKKVGPPTYKAGNFQPKAKKTKVDEELEKVESELKDVESELSKVRRLRQAKFKLSQEKNELARMTDGQSLKKDDDRSPYERYGYQ